MSLRWCRSISVALLCLTSIAVAADQKWIRRDIPAGGRINLKDFGGPDRDIGVRDSDPRKVLVRSVDRTRVIPKMSRDIYGYATVIYVSPTEDWAVPKKNGVSVDGRSSEAYKIYEDRPSGVQVYFYDTLDTKQNEYALLIVPRRSPPPPFSQPPTTLQPDRQLRISESAGPLEAITTLTEPYELTVLSIEDREINSRYKRLMYWVATGKAQGRDPHELLRVALSANRTDSKRAALIIEMVMRSFAEAEENGWLTPANLTLMRDGKSGSTSDGEQIEVDHIVPISRFPQFANELANLQLLRESENTAKGDQMTPEAEAHLELLKALPPSPSLYTSQITAGHPLGERITPTQSLPSIPSSVPGWSVIGDTLLYQGKPLTDRVTRDAAHYGLNRDLFIQERVWAEKERIFGRENAGEYEELKAQRLKGRSNSEKAAIETLRSAALR